VSPACCVRTVEEEYLVSSGEQSYDGEESAQCEEYTTRRLRGKVSIVHPVDLVL